MKPLLFIALIVNLIAAEAFSKESVTLPLKAIPSHLKVDRIIQVDQFRVVAILADSLFEVGTNLQVEGKLAKKSYWDKNQKTLFIELGNTKFNDGSPLNVQFVIDSISACVKTSEKNTTSALLKLEDIDPLSLGRKSH